MIKLIEINIKVSISYFLSSTTVKKTRLNFNTNSSANPQLNIKF